jgi:hypothetical protein
VGRLTRRRLGALVALSLCAAMAVPPAASAALLVWSLTPLTVAGTAGQVTTVTFTATNLDVLGRRDVGCVEIELPESYVFKSVQGISASNGREWDWFILDRFVHVHSVDGGGRLEPPLASGLIGESVTFKLTFVAPAAGVTSWSNHVHQSQHCDDDNEIGAPVTATFLPPILATPTPRPTPRPTPVATPKPTPIPTPKAEGPPVRPTPTVRSEATASATPDARTPSPTPASSSADAVPSSTAAIASPPPGTGAPRGSQDAAAPVVDLRDAETSLAIDAIDVMAGVEVYAVPAAAIALPGVVLLIWLGLQTIGALAWIPAVRRLRGGDDPEP